MEKLLTPKQVAYLLGYTPRSLYNLRQRGTGPAFVRLGGPIRGKVMYRREDVEAFIVEHIISGEVQND